MTIERILIIRLSSIGDIVLTTPLIRQARMAFPQARIDFLTRATFAELLLHNPYLSQVLTLEGFQPALYDLCIDLQNNFRSRWLRRALARHVTSYRKENWKKLLLIWFKWNLLAQSPPVPLRYLSTCQKFGIQDDGKGCDIFLSEASQRFAAAAIEAKTTLAVCYGAAHFTKRFPIDKLALVLNTLLNEQDIQILLLGGADNVALGKKLLTMLAYPERVKDFSGKCSLLETAALLARADAVLTNDTGLMHIGAAFQKPIVAVFGSSVREFGFTPFRTSYQILEREGLKCRPCSHIGRKSCPARHFKCMQEIDPLAVLQAILSALHKRPSMLLHQT